MDSLLIIPKEHYNDHVKMSYTLKRIAQIVEGNESFHKRDDDTGWNIGQGNNWWLIHRPEGHETGDAFFLSYRYAKSNQWMKSITDAIVWLADLEHFQIK